MQHCSFLFYHLHEPLFGPEVEYESFLIIVVNTFLVSGEKQSRVSRDEEQQLQLVCCFF